MLEIDAFDERTCGFNVSGTGKKVLLIGDSHAASLYPGLKAWADRNHVRLATLTAAYCLPLVTSFRGAHAKTTTDRCAAINRKIASLIASDHFDAVVISAYIQEWEFNGNPDWTYPGYYDDYVKALRFLASTLPVVVVGEFPVWKISLPEVILKEIGPGGAIATVPAYSFDDVDMEVFKTDHEVASDLSQPGIHYVSVLQHLCNEKGCLRYVPEKDGPQLMSQDYGHLSLAASHLVAEKIVDPALRNVLSVGAPDVHAAR